MAQKQISQKIQVHKYDVLMKNVYGLIERDLSPENIRLIQKYDRTMANQSMAIATRQKHLRTLLSLTRLLNKNWLDVTKEDIDELVYKIMTQFADSSGQESNYSYDHKKILKIFVRWFRLDSREFSEVGDPPEIKGVRLKKVKDKIVREDLLTEEDRTRLLNACGENARDRALIDCQFEGGTRPGEILSLRIKHVKFDKHGAVLHVDGKTGARTVRLVRSTPSLASWLSVHPYKDNSDAPLWISLYKINYGKSMTYASARSMIERRARIAHLSKRVYLNLFRHSEATQSAKFMTEAQLRKRHGWSPESKMPSRYVHMINADVDEAIFKQYGIKVNEDETKQKLPIKCPVCEFYNSPETKLCSKCGKSLNLKTALETEETNIEKQQMLEDKIARQEQVTKVILEKLSKLEKNTSS